MSIEEAIRQISAAGLLVNNLFQSRAMRGMKQDCEWQANLRTVADPTADYFEFGKGKTPEEALNDAFKKAKSTTPRSNDVPKFLPKAHVKVTAPNLDDLL